jgi:hypothetical protein
MSDKGYNGWTNYETWAINLWLGNDEGSYNYWRERAQEAWGNATAQPPAFTRDERAALDLAGVLKDDITESAPDLGASLFSDLLNSALSEVHWYQIASHMIEDVDKTEDAEQNTEA